MLRISLSLMLLAMTVGCHVESKEREGVRYVQAQVGLGVGDDSGALPNLVELDIPVMYTHIESPLLTNLAKAAWLGSGNIVDLVADGIAKLFGADN